MVFADKSAPTETGATQSNFGGGLKEKARLEDNATLASSAPTVFNAIHYAAGLYAQTFSWLNA
jgi:hypothetical protein